MTPTSSTRPRVPLVYLLAASHSGSTMTAMLLGSHPDVCTIGELQAPSLGDRQRYLCSCGTPITSCTFWNGITEDMAKAGYTFDVTQAGTDLRTTMTPYVRRLLRPLHRGRTLEAVRDTGLWLSRAWRRRYQDVQALNVALARCVCARTGKKVIVDSSKIGIRLKYLLRNPELDIRVIRLVRDGRGVALTYVDPAQFADARDPSRRGGGHGASRDAERLTLAQAAREWRRSNEEAEAIVATVDPSFTMTVKYETLCEETEATLARIFSFIGVPPAPVASRFRDVDHHVIGNGMRLDSSREIRLDERWRRVWTRAELATFDTVAGPLNARLGYAS